MSDAALAGLHEELAEVARETARLLLDPEHDGADVLALDVRAEALRERIAALTRQPERGEPVELWRGGGALLVSDG
jgi:hypothetical protein